MLRTRRQRQEFNSVPPKHPYWSLYYLGAMAHNVNDSSASATITRWTKPRTMPSVNLRNSSESILPFLQGKKYPVPPRPRSERWPRVLIKPEVALNREQKYKKKLINQPTNQLTNQSINQPLKQDKHDSSRTPTCVHIYSRRTTWNCKNCFVQQANLKRTSNQGCSYQSYGLARYVLSKYLSGISWGLVSVVPIKRYEPHE